MIKVNPMECVSLYRPSSSSQEECHGLPTVVVDDKPFNGMIIEMERPRPKRRSSMIYAYTALVFLGHLSLGLVRGIHGPSLVDLSYLLKETDQNQNNQTSNCPECLTKTGIQEASLFFAFFFAGSIGGALWTSLYKIQATSRWLNRQLLTATFVIMATVIHITIPWIKSVSIFYLASSGLGFGLGGWNAVATMWLMEMWSGPMMASLLHAIQVMYGLGCIFSPIMARFFVTGFSDSKTTVDFELISTRRSQLAIPFLITGIQMLIPVSLIFFLFFTPVRYRSPAELKLGEKTFQQSSSKVFDLTGNHRYRMAFHILISALFITSQVVDAGFLNFQFLYFEVIGMSAVQANDLASIGAIAYTVGRGAAIFIVRVMSPGWILLSHYLLALAGFIGLGTLGTIYQGQQQSWLWWFMVADRIVIGYAVSVIFPTVFALVSEHVTVDDRHNALYFTSSCLPMLFVPMIIGPLALTWPHIVIYLSLASSLISTILMIIIKLLVHKTKQFKLP